MKNETVQPRKNIWHETSSKPSPTFFIEPRSLSGDAKGRRKKRVVAARKRRSRTEKRAGTRKGRGSGAGGRSVREQCERCVPLSQRAYRSHPPVGNEASRASCRVSRRVGSGNKKKGGWLNNLRAARVTRDQGAGRRTGNE